MASGRGRAVAVAALVAAVTGVGVALVLAGDDTDAPQGDVAGALAAARPAVAPFADLTEADLAVGGDCRRVVVADDEAERARGLMGVTDLGPYDGMLFVLDAERTARFHMQDTLVPLDIGFYRADGSPVGRLTMQPCPPDVRPCPTYGPDKPFLLALETPEGGLGAGALDPCGA